MPPTWLPSFRGLLATGLPLPPAPASFIDPLSPAGLFALPPPLFPTPPNDQQIQPQTIPLLTTLSTTPSARHLLAHLSTGIKELQRTRSRSLYEFEEGEYGLGKEGIAECRERLEGLVDALVGAGTGGAGESESDGSEQDEDWGME